MILSVTSTVANARSIEACGFNGTVVASEDVLYEGPLHSDLDPVAMARERARYFSSCGMNAVQSLADNYSRRISRLNDFPHYQSLVLWFSQNLYNQLLQLQMLHWLERQDTGRLEIALASPGMLPVSKNVQSFDVLNSDQILSLYNRRTEVSILQLQMASTIWEAICSDDPRDLLSFTNADLGALPHLSNAILRLLQQFPAKSNGLSRSERQILEIMTTGESEPSRIFMRTQRKEDFPFMNQMMFWLTASRLIQADQPAIELEERTRTEKMPDGFRREISETHFILTELGREVLKNNADWVQLNGIDRWVGGVHLNAGNIWRWEGSHRNIARTYV